MPTPAAAAVGATRPIWLAYCATIILPSFCVCIKPSTSFCALLDSSPYALRTEVVAFATVFKSDSPPTAPSEDARRTSVACDAELNPAEATS